MVLVRVKIDWAGLPPWREQVWRYALERATFALLRLARVLGACATIGVEEE